MRVAMLVRRFPKLSETFILNQITGLIDAGHHVDIYAGAPGEDAKTHADVERYGLKARTTYPDIPKPRGARIARATQLLVDHELWRRPRIVLGALNAARYGAHALSLNLLYTTLGFLDQPPYDILHAQFGTLGATADALVRIGATSGRIVVSFRGSDLTIPENVQGYEELFERADLILPVCRAFAVELERRGCDPAKIRVLHSGIDVATFPFSERTLGRGEPTKILTVGRLEEKKGISFALQAVALIRSRGFDVRYTVVGDGQLRPELERTIAELDLAGVASLVGHKSQEEIVGLLHAHHLFTAPSVTASNGDQEGIPNVLKEAMATGMPVVSTLHSGIPELVEDGVSGYLVPERDEEALADRIQTLIAEPGTWEAMGRAGRSRVVDGFDSSALDQRLVDLYRDVIRGSTLRA